MKRVFISYAHEDAPFRDALATHLQGLCMTGVIEQWHDGRISPGEDWKTTIDHEIGSADIVVLLVSANFLASRSCQELELVPALTRWRDQDVLIIPVIVRACDWDASPLAKLQVLPAQGRPVATWPHQDDAWTDVTRKIRAAATRPRIKPTTTTGFPAGSPAPEASPVARGRAMRRSRLLVVTGCLAVPIALGLGLWHPWTRTNEAPDGSISTSGADTLAHLSVGSAVPSPSTSAVTPAAPVSTDSLPSAPGASPPAPSQTALVRPLGALEEAGLEEVIEGLAHGVTPESRFNGSIFGGHLSQGQMLEHPIVLQPNHCYSVVAAGRDGVDEVDIMIVGEIGSFEPIVLAQDKDVGANATIGTGKDGCWRYGSPCWNPAFAHGFPATCKDRGIPVACSNTSFAHANYRLCGVERGKVLLQITKGQGAVAARVYVK